MYHFVPPRASYARPGPPVEPPVETTGPTAPDLSDYLGLLRRQWWLVVLGCVLGVGGGFGANQVMAKTYESVTSVLVQPAGQDTNVAGGRTKGDINLDTEAQLVGSTQIAVGAADLLRSGDAPDVLAKGVSVTSRRTPRCWRSPTSADPARAQAGSHAFAEAYLRNREASAQAGIDAPDLRADQQGQAAQREAGEHQHELAALTQEQRLASPAWRASAAPTRASSTRSAAS